MFWKVSPAALMAFILLVAISGRNVHAVAPSLSHDGAGTSDHSRQPHSTSHRADATTSGDDPRSFWTSTEENSAFDGGPVVRMIHRDKGVLCMGSLAQLTDRNGRPFTAVIIPWACWEVDIENQQDLVRAVDHKGKLIQASLEYLHTRSDMTGFAVFRATGNDELDAVPVAKPRMPRDGTIIGVTDTGKNGRQSFQVVNGDRCRPNLEPQTHFCTWQLGDGSGKVDVIFGAPFFIKRSGQLYLAGLHVVYEERIEDNGSRVGGNLYEVVNEEKVRYE